MWTQDTVLSVVWLATLFVVMGQNFTSTLGICQNFRFVMDDNVVTDHALEGHVFKISTVERATQCHVMCKNDCRCVSMNYLRDNEQDNCELNDVNKEMKPAALEYKPGASYYDLVRDYTVHGRSFFHGRDRCVNSCCQPNACLNGGTCEEICDPTSVRFNCTCSDDHTGQRCEKLKYPRSCNDLETNGVKIPGTYTVCRNQNELFEVHCDFDSEPDFVWTLVQSFYRQNAAQFANKIFGVNFPVNENGGTINWTSYRLSLSHMRSIAEVSTHLRATCNFPDDGLMYTDYARAKLQGHDLFGAWKAQCRMCELVIRGLKCCDCTAGTWQKAGQSWHINSYLSAEKGWRFNGTKGAVNYEQNFGRYLMANPSFRCTSNQNATTQHWIGSKLSN